MDTIYNNLMATTPARPAEHTLHSTQEKNVQKDDSFEKLMQQNAAEEKSKGNALESADSRQTEQTNEKPLENGLNAEVPHENDEMETRMMLAAMAAAQVIVPVQQDSAMVQTGEANITDLNSAIIQPQQTVQLQDGLQTENAIADDTALQRNAMQPNQTDIAQSQIESMEMKLPRSQAQNAAEAVGTEMDEPNILQHGAEAETPLFREVEAVPVQVGETQAAHDKQNVSVTKQVFTSLENAVKNGQKVIELELEPHNLGRVHIEMLLQKDGTMHISLHADKPATQILLDRDAAELQSALMRNTRQDVQVETTHQQENAHLNYDEQQNDGRDQQQNHHRQEQSDNGESFLQQLRLGLVTGDALAS